MPASQHPTITVIINGKDYRLNADNPAALSQLPTADGAELLHLLEALKRERQRASKAVQDALQKKPQIKAKTPQEQARSSLAKTDRLGRGDADALMAQLVAEEARNRKPGLSPQGVYKFVGGSALLVILLLLIAL